MARVLSRGSIRGALFLTLAFTAGCDSGGAPHAAGRAAVANSTSHPPSNMGAGPDSSVFDLHYRVAPGDAGLGEGARFALRDDGHLFILDRMASQIHEYGTDGVRLRTLGGPGRGPGEITGGDDLTILPDGGIALVSRPLGRVTVWNLEGSLRWTAPLSLGLLPQFVLRTDELWVRTIPPGVFREPYPGIWRRFDPATGEIIEERETHPLQGNDRMCTGCRLVNIPDRQFVGEPQNHGVGRAIAIGEPEGEASQVFDHPDRPHTDYTEEELEGLREARLNSLSLTRSLFGMPPASERTRALVGPPPAASRPRHFHEGSFGVDRWSRIWALPNTHPDEGAVVDLFSVEGEWLGTFRLPVPHTRTALRVSGEFMAVHWLDEMGLPGYSVFRLR